MYSPNPTPSSNFKRNWDKFRLVLWKNYLLQLRHKKQMVFEILLPVLLISILLLVRLIDQTNHIPDKIFKPFTADEINKKYVNKDFLL